MEHPADDGGKKRPAEQSRAAAAVAGGAGTGSSRATDETIGSKQRAAALGGAKTKSKRGRGQEEERYKRDNKIINNWPILTQADNLTSAPGSNIRTKGLAF